MTKLTIFDHAVFAHSQWKRRLRQAIETGKSQWTVAEVRADDRCDFGDWLKRLPVSKKMSEPYSDLRSLHAEFHKAASEVLQLALAGKKGEAEAAISMGSHFSQISAKLVLTLSNWAKSEPEQS
jgi:hypothetical protein